MVKEIDSGKICWNQPAGHVEVGESIKDAAIRETLEETGYRVKLDSVQGFYQGMHTQSGTHYVRVSFIGTVLEKTDGELDSDIIEAKWLDIDDLKNGKYPLRSKLTRQALEDFGVAPIYPIEIIHNFTTGEAK